MPSVYLFIVTIVPVSAFRLEPQNLSLEQFSKIQASTHMYHPLQNIFYVALTLSLVLSAVLISKERSSCTRFLYVEIFISSGLLIFQLQCTQA